RGLLPGPALLPPAAAPARRRGTEDGQVPGRGQGANGTVPALARPARPLPRRGGAGRPHPLRREDRRARRAVGTGGERHPGGPVPARAPPAAAPGAQPPRRDPRGTATSAVTHRGDGRAVTPSGNPRARSIDIVTTHPGA